MCVSVCVYVCVCVCVCAYHQKLSELIAVKYKMPKVALTVVEGNKPCRVVCSSARAPVCLCMCVAVCLCVCVRMADFSCLPDFDGCSVCVLCCVYVFVCECDFVMIICTKRKSSRARVLLE